MGPFDTLTQENYEQFRLRNSLLIKPTELFQSHLQNIAKNIYQHQWQEVENGIGTEFPSLDKKSSFFLNHIFNEEKVLKIVQQLLQTRKKLRFEGRPFKLPTDSKFPWHTDTNEKTRRLAISLNLSISPFKGGNFQLRKRGHRRLLCDIRNLDVGSMILFRIDPHLEHRVLPILGRKGKLTYAGFFREIKGTDRKHSTEI